MRRILAMPEVIQVTGPFGSAKPEAISCFHGQQDNALPQASPDDMGIMPVVKAPVGSAARGFFLASTGPAGRLNPPF